MQLHMIKSLHSTAFTETSSLSHSNRLKLEWYQLANLKNQQMISLDHTALQYLTEIAHNYNNSDSWQQLGNLIIF